MMNSPYWTSDPAAYDGLDASLVHHDRVHRLFQQAIGSRGATLCLCGLDNMRQVNQKSGRMAGDAVLQAAWQHVVQLATPEGVAARVAGDVFAFAVPSPLPSPPWGARLLAAKPVATQVREISWSIGCARVPPAAQVADWTVAFEQAAHGLGEAKARGGNLVLLLNPDGPFSVLASGNPSRRRYSDGDRSPASSNPTA
jgi:GGDEF domain-containing protein